MAGIHEADDEIIGILDNTTYQMGIPIRDVLRVLVKDIIEEKIGRIYVRWCKKEITGDDAMHQIYGLFREACNRVWRQDQNIGKGKPGRKPRR